MEKIELRWLRRIVEKNGYPMVEQVLQFRKFMDFGAWAGGTYDTYPAKNLRWSEWIDVPMVFE